MNQTLRRAAVLPAVFLSVGWLYGCGSSLPGLPSTSTGGSASSNPAFSQDIMGLFAANGCSAAGCHNGPGATGGLDLSTAAVAYDELLGRNGAGSNHGPVVIASDEANSILVKKLRTETLPFGSRMPFGGAPVSDASLELIKKWIANGAPNN